MTIATEGIDLAKNVFAVHAVGKSGLVELKRPEVRRAKLLELVASWPPCLIGMETCSGAHHRARELAAHFESWRAFTGSTQNPSIAF